ncbi:MAG TPA: hypothetical protein VF732_02695, partial [Nitrospira sp.]
QEPETETWTSNRTTGQDAVDASFEKEVVGLFALEAHEWLAQIHSALKRLGEGSNGTTRSKLHGIMLQGLTNLARSAATVHLTSIEGLALGLLPILHDVGRQESRANPSALASLQAGLDRITTAVRHAEGSQATGESSEPFAGYQTTNHTGKTDVIPEPLVAAAPVTSVTATSGPSLLNALRDLQEVRSRSVQPARDVLEAVILRADQEPECLTVDGIRRILEDLDRMDERFVDEVSRRVPAMTHTLADLRKDGATNFVTAAQLDPIIQHVEALHDASASVQAGMITMFLQGLRSFLMVSAYRKAATLPQRLATVETRIQALVPMAEQWVNVGRVERSAIAEILPVT